MPEPSAFDELMGTLDYSMLLITVRRGEERAGCLIGFASQASIDPPRFMACLSEQNHTYRVAREAEHLAVHLVPADAHDLAELFGGETGDDADKFAQCDWEDGPHGLPILKRCENWFVGRVVERHGFGDHVGFLLAPDVVHHASRDRPLNFHRAQDIDPGHDA